MSLRRFGVFTVLLQLSALAGAHAAAAGSAVLVPFVGCPSDGQVGPVAPPSGKPIPVNVSPKVAAQLAFYNGTYGQGVFAPAGWHCREWYGSNGSFVVVTPAAPPDRFPAEQVTGPGVERVLRNGGTSGRFDVAAISARFFPNVMREFIQGVRDEHLVPDSTFEPTRFPKDTAKRIGERMVEFSTPAREEGFGTEGLLAQSEEPIRGIVALNPPTEEAGISVLRLRLPVGREALSAAIVAIEAQCLERPQGCETPP